MKDGVNKLIAQIHWFVLGYGLWTAFDTYWVPHQTEIESLRQEVESSKTDLETSKQKVRDIENYRKSREESEARVLEVENAIMDAQRKLPETINDVEIRSYLQSETQALNIKDLSISSGDEKESVFYYSKPFKITARGTFLQFLVFFERLGTASRIYNITDVTFNTDAGGGRGRFQMVSVDCTIVAYRYNPKFKISRTEGP